MPSGVEPNSRVQSPSAALSLYHLLDPVVLANPYPLFHRLRTEDPVHWDPFLHSWIVTRYADVLEVLHDYSADRTPTPEQLAAMDMPQFGPIAQLMVKQMLFMDAKQHGRLRGLASRAFTPARVDALRSHIVEVVNNLLDSFQGRRSVDVIAELAEPLPAIITAELLGVPVKDHQQLKQWSASFAEMLGNFQHNPEHTPLVLKTVEAMTAYFREAIADTRKHPREGLIHSFLTAEIDGDRLSDEEVVANVILTMVGGQETTTNLIGNGVLTLLRHPEQLEKLRDNLALIPSAVEEMLRFESPSQHTARLAPSDRILGGKSIQKRQAVIAVMAAANRDPQRFPDPDRFDITRVDNRHLAFGYAAHFCFGAPLARLEGQVAFEALLQRFPSFRLEPQNLAWRTNLGLRGLNSLKIAIDEPRKIVSSPPEHSQAQPKESVKEDARSVAAPSPAHDSSPPNAELRRMLIEWNSTAKPYPADKCIHELVEIKAIETPRAIAAASGRRNLTYADLNARANQLAHILRQKGVGADIPVAICLNRSLELLVALLGVLKSGGACVPLDPEYPSERLTYILEDSRAPVLITQTQLRPVLGETAAQALLLDPEWKLLDGQSPENLPAHTTPENLAYVIYTSGSTGKPRGVLLTHRGLVNHGVASIDLYGLTAADRVLQFASISFDIAIEETLPTWFAGGCVIPRDSEAPLNASDFLKWIEGRRISVLDLPTAYWHELVRELAESEQSLPTCLRLVIVGGEKASSSAFAAWLKAGGACVRWINTYGPTEGSVIATAYEPNPKKPLPDNLPIGRPIANVRVYVLDTELRPVPVGTAGELHIGGPGVARGYLNHPQLTAAKFISDPFDPSPHSRLYKTGDMARYLPDGNLEFVGRIDFQVKIRGFRVELGEIEAVLEKHPGVTQAVVVAREANGEKQLIAYVLAAPDGVEIAELRTYAKKHLPDYMIPAAFIFLETLPLTPNGKVDRRALPEPSVGPEPTEGFVAPRDEFEGRMAALWKHVLGKNSIGVRDNFFDLGGHSLLALRLTSRIEKEFGKKLTLTALLQAPTVEELVRLVRKDNISWSPAIVLQGKGSKPTLFFVHGLGGTVMRFHELARHMAPDQPFVSFQAQGIDGDLPVLDNVQDMAELYLEHMRELQPAGPYYLGGYSFGGLVALEMARRLLADGQEVGLLALVDTYLVGQSNSSLLNRFFSLSTEQKLAYIRKRAVRYRRGIKRRIDALSLPAPVKAVREACARAEQQYQPSSYPGRVVLFRASEQALRGLENGHNTWQKYAGGGFEVHEVDGDHGNVLNEPNVRQLAALLRARIEQALAEFNDSARGEITVG